MAVLVCAGCSTLARKPPDAKRAFYASHAGPPVPSFRSLGRFDNWEPLGRDALVVWTRPNEAWLLELYGPCDGLDFSIAIALTDHVGRVEAGMDDVLVSHPSPLHIPCRIRTIRPIDVAAVRAAEKVERAGAKR
jgi:hypothetical protein